MASNDWTLVTNALSGGNCARGVTRGIARPNGGGNFCYGINALTNTPGSVALYATPQPPNTNFNPMLKGGEVRGAIQRGVGGGNTGMAAYLFAMLQGVDVGDLAYVLGLSDGDPAHLELRKGALSLGLPDEAPGGVSKILRQSTTTFTPGTWVHLRLEVVVNLSGDVVLNVYQSDLVANAVTSPVWVAVPGMTQYIDDVLGVNSGTVPYINGRCGFGGRVADTVRRCFFDHLEVIKQN